LAHRMFPQKRMRNVNPNGNIIVKADGTYNRFDNDLHRDRFDKIREHYIVGDPNDHRFLKPAEIRRLAPSFLSTLNVVFNSKADAVFQVIGRKGRVLDEIQVSKLLKWLNN